MALLLRMQGIPARVATGFTSGSYDRRAKEYVVRDLDAHSWVEAWFPDLRLGHVRPDAVGRAAALAERRPRRGPARRRARPRRRRQARSARRHGATEGPPWALYIGGGVLAVLLLAGGSFAFLHRGRYPARCSSSSGRCGARAGCRTRRDAAGARGVVRPLARRQGYVRALREQRYSGRGEAPTSAQRKGLRSELGRGGGRARAAPRVVGAAAETPAARPLNSIRMADVYDLFQRGTALLEAGDFAAATVPLAKARDLDPDKTSIREALGRAYFRSSQFEAARAEFEAIVERAPTNDYALFCLGRSLLELGRPKDARKALALAAGLRPDRRDYRIYRDRARAAA
jgi:Flp pilus assembly protein TadD